MQLFLRQALGLENEAPNVEINFNIDNDEDNDETPVDTEESIEDGDNSDDTDTDDGLTDVSSAKADAIEADAEEERAEDELEELEEAQDALESMKLLVDKRHGITLEEFEMYQLVASHVTRRTGRLETISSETIIQSDYHRKLIVEELLNATLESITVASMEAKESLWERVKNKVARFQDLERAIVKKATTLRELATDSRSEHVDIEYIKFDDKNTPRFKQLRSNAVNDFRELIKNIKAADSFFAHIKMPNIAAGDDKAIVNSMTNFTEGWELIDGVDTIEFFNVSIQKNSNLTPDTRTSDKDIEQLPILTAKECEEVLNLVIQLSKHRGKVEQLTGILRRLDKSSDKFQFSSKAAYNGIKVLQNVRVEIMDELVKYCQLSLSHLGSD